VTVAQAAGTGPVVLDIGAEIGALVVWAPPELAGAEVEICPAGRRSERPDEGRGWWDGEWRHNHDHPTDHRIAAVDAASGLHSAWPHVAVLARPTPAGLKHAAVFPGLRAGPYELWLRPDLPTAVTAAVRGGEVVSVRWPAD
jgi:hypothetical protein